MLIYLPFCSFADDIKLGGVADGEMGQKEPHEVQQKEIPSPASAEE